MNDVLTWARRWARRPAAIEHELLEVSKLATLEGVRAAYHKLARFAHPDLHRTALSVEQLEEVTIAFARVSNAYAVISTRLRRSGQRPSIAAPIAAQPANATEKQPEPARPASATAVANPGPTSPSKRPEGAPSLPIGPSNAMSPKALVHYRRAELSLRRGDLAEAMLHLRLAVVTDPQSAFLRKALADIGGK
jgi:DnaJ domain